MKQLITPLPLTPQSFAPFGRVLDNYDGPCTKEGENWICYSPVDFLMPDVPMGVGIVYCNTPPTSISALERHVSREELLWATTQDLVMAVDLPIFMGDENALPDAETCKVFLIKAGQAIIINRGTWHSPCFAVEGKAKYYFLVERKPDLIDQDAQPWIPFQGGETISIRL